MDNKNENEMKRERRESLRNLKHGDVIGYLGGSLGEVLNHSGPPNTYLIVDRVEDGKVYGCLAQNSGVNAVRSIDQLLETHQIFKVKLEKI